MICVRCVNVLRVAPWLHAIRSVRRSQGRSLRRSPEARSRRMSLLTSAVYVCMARPRVRRSLRRSLRRSQVRNLGGSLRRSPRAPRRPLHARGAGLLVAGAQGGGRKEA